MDVWHLGIVQKTSHMQCIRIVYISKIIIIIKNFNALGHIFHTSGKFLNIRLYGQCRDDIAAEIANKRHVFLFLKKSLPSNVFLSFFFIIHSYKIELRKIRRLMCYFAGFFFFFMNYTRIVCKPEITTFTNMLFEIQ